MAKATSKSAESAFVLHSPTNAEVEEGTEVQLPCKLYARIVSSLATERQAQEFKRAFQEVGGKKAIEDPARVSGAKAIKASILVLSRYNVVYIRTPDGNPLQLTGLSSNGNGPNLSFPAKIEAEKDIAEILRTFPQIRQEIRDAVEAEGESLDTIAEGLAGN